MANAEFGPRARREIHAAASWILQDSPVAARRFQAAVVDAGRLIGRHPLVGSVRPDLAPEPIRFLMVARFSYLIAYNPDASPPLVLRVVHTSRDLPTAFADLN